MSGKPIFYNCWNKNVICAFKTSDGAQWFATLGKHSRHFPFYDTAYDNVMFYNKTTKTGYGLTQDTMAGLQFSSSGDSLNVRYKGPLIKYDARGQAQGKAAVEINLNFKTSPIKKDLLFLKRIIPVKSRFVPGAIFNNQLLAQDPSSPGSVTIDGGLLEISGETCHGHWENGESSLIATRAWLIPYRYLGLLKEDEKKTHFYYRWQIRTMAPRSSQERFINLIKRKINKEISVCRNGHNLEIAHGPLEGLPRQISPTCQLFVNTHQMGEFAFTRSFVEVKGAGGAFWYGILENFRHPDLGI